MRIVFIVAALIFSLGCAHESATSKNSAQETEIKIGGALGAIQRLAEMEKEIDANEWQWLESYLRSWPQLKPLVVAFLDDDKISKNEYQVIKNEAWRLIESKHRAKEAKKIEEIKGRILKGE